MFYGKQKEYTIARPVVVKDAYNHETTNYVSEGTAMIHIVVQDRSMVRANDLDTYKSIMVGYTRNPNIQKGWRIGSSFTVTSTMPHRNLNVLYLEAFENGR